MPNPTLEQELEIQKNIHRDACLIGALEAVSVAVANEEDRVYAEYLDTTVRGFLEEELERANAAHKEYLRELGLREA